MLDDIYGRGHGGEVLSVADYEFSPSRRRSPSWACVGEMVSSTTTAVVLVLSLFHPR